jgi:Protein of unknown function (DUF2961)
VNSLQMQPLLIAAVLTAAAAIGASSAAHAEDPPPGIERFSRIDLLPQLRQSVRTDSFSSYDRTGGNDDGFSGKYSFLRKEGDALVIAEMKGPGCITRIWTPTPTDDPLEFYFDGETTPRVTIGFRELFLGTKPPFVAPLSGYGSGGFYCYVPMPYSKSCKVLFRGKLMQFFQINYATYDASTQLTSFDPSAPALSGEAMQRAQKLLTSAGQDIAAFSAPEGSSLKTSHVNGTLKPVGSLTLFQGKTGGRVVGIRIKGAHALARKDRSIVLRAFWDGSKAPAILCPAGDFFGAAWGQPAMRSVMIGSDADTDTDYCYFPMPYAKSARIELVSENAAAPPVQISAEAVSTDIPLKKGGRPLLRGLAQRKPHNAGKAVQLCYGYGQRPCGGSGAAGTGQHSWHYTLL